MSRSRDRLPIPAFALLLALAASSGRALPPCTGRLDVQPPPGAGAHLGGSVATDGAIVASGAHEDSAAAPGAGAIYVLQRGGSVRLTAADAAAHDLLGFALALEGSTLVAGAPLGDAPGAADAGAVYVFSRPGSSWSAAAPQVKLTAPNARRNDQFGQALALSGDRIAVGAPDRTGAGSLSGAVYVFKRSGSAWTLEAEIDDPDAAPFDGFGSALALDGDTLAVGAPFANDPGRGSTGAVHVFVREGGSWVTKARIVDPAGFPGDEVGFSLALSRGILVAGARRADVFGLIDAGAALVFVRAEATAAQWTLGVKLTAVPPGADDLFGAAVAIAGSRIVVGAPYHDAAAHNGGAGFVFEALSYPPLVLLGGPPEEGAALGQSVAAFGDSVVLGAHLASSGSGGLLACPSPLAPCPATAVTHDDGVAQVRPGETVTYRIGVTRAAPGATVADDFTAILANGGWCRGEGCTDFRPGPLADVLQDGGSAVYRVRGVVPQATTGPLITEVCVAATGCMTVCARDVDALLPADLACTQTGPAAARLGETVTYSIQVDNLGGFAATGVVLRSRTPAGLTFVRADPPCAGGNCWLGRIDGGSRRSQRITYRVTIPGPAEVRNEVTVAGRQIDPTPGDAVCPATTTIRLPFPIPTLAPGMLAAFAALLALAALRGLRRPRRRSP
ncbi:MAG TPA: hypothetical protein VGS22_01255 [Thermoanaerobaculia bacterium]|jgi:uncharacterized repeat protein (TIGR01451 family)|nr:hypothetical protein [Thermoanaerobaculia bacterium]